MAKVIRQFRDRATWKTYNEGDEYVGDRVAELAALGYVESALKPEPKRRATRKTAAKE